MINLVNTAFAITSCALDIVYTVKVTFHMEILHWIAIVALLTKLIVAIVVGYYMYNKHVKNYNINMCGQEKKNQDGDESDGNPKYDEHTLKDMGERVYKSLFFTFYTGSFRLLSSTDFGGFML